MLEFDVVIKLFFYKNVKSFELTKTNAFLLYKNNINLKITFNYKDSNWYLFGA